MTEQSDPIWWIQALELEKANKLTQAEKVIRQALDPRGDPSSAQIAHLYEVRCRRLIKQGDLAAARDAAVKGHEFMREYASGATSGGEGVALSQEANDYWNSLNQMLRNAIQHSRKS